MGLVIDAVNAAVCGGLAFLSLYAVLSPKVNDGVVIKLGLCVMTVAFSALSYFSVSPDAACDGERFQKGTLLLGVGIAVVIVGYFLRTSRAGHAQRRRTDFADLDETPEEA